VRELLEPIFAITLLHRITFLIHQIEGAVF
jgi:hypothetical protein